MEKGFGKKGVKIILKTTTILIQNQLPRSCSSSYTGYINFFSSGSLSLLCLRCNITGIVLIHRYTVVLRLVEGTKPRLFLFKYAGALYPCIVVVIIRKYD